MITQTWSPVRGCNTRLGPMKPHIPVKFLLLKMFKKYLVLDQWS